MEEGLGSLSSSKLFNNGGWLEEEDEDEESLQNHTQSSHLRSEKWKEARRRCKKCSLGFAPMKNE